MCRWWLFYFLPLCLLTSEVSLQETVEGFIGGSAVLPCSSEEPLNTVQDIGLVRWTHRGNNVYIIINGQVSVEEQDPEYKNRVESFPEEYLRGNFSIKLNNLQYTDAGLYKCFISEKYVIRSVELFTQEREAMQIPNEGTKPRPDVIAMIIYVLCIGMIFSLVNSVTACF
ncbi:V-set domain-containing T-cell activation inhibitor 1 isoform X4 [Carassius gibelio]|uniref:V-set domain-containing T-cell activation inhibitor 1 isoform X4 n=1 Tax=Carassius gibelio TaxID=101364 RepID=UPI00227808DA|nr:V-set domain-containing T-cell activation inhibitor 1 isoform X4 [Carassius gibelio]